MSPAETLTAAGRWWLIELAPDNRRVMAEVFDHPRGLVFADIGWNRADNPGHPFHVVEGNIEVEGEGFRIGPARIQPIDEDDPLAWEWLNWVNYVSTAEGKHATREACADAMLSSGIMEA